MRILYEPKRLQAVLCNITELKMSSFAGEPCLNKNLFVCKTSLFSSSKLLFVKDIQPNVINENLYENKKNLSFMRTVKFCLILNFFPPDSLKRSRF